MPASSDSPSPGFLPGSRRPARVADHCGLDGGGSSPVRAARPARPRGRSGWGDPGRGLPRPRRRGPSRPGPLVPAASHCGPRHRSPNSNRSRASLRAGASQEPPPRQETHPGAPQSARSPGNPRARTSGRRARGLSDVLADPGRAGAGSRTESATAPDPTRTTTAHAEPGLDVQENASMWTWKWTGPAHRARPAHGCPTVAAGWPRPRAPDPACTMRAQRNTIHPASHRASPARRNPPALDPRHPTSHNASPGDTTKVIQWGSWQRSPAWTTCVLLGHLGSVGPPRVTFRIGSLWKSYE